MAHCWTILAVLTLARTTMGFQFQSVAALGPALTAETAISYAALGALMGMYLLPGAFIAIPGGWLGSRFGDKRVVLIGLALMTAGGALLALSDVYEVMLAGRLISGTGAVLLNVLLSKMVTDWFAARGIVTAMGILISSWPLGIAIALVSFAPLAELAGTAGAFTIPVVVCAIAMLLVGAVYTNPPAGEEHAVAKATASFGRLTATEWWGAGLSGAVWCFYNVAFILPLSFGPEFLNADGLSLAEAGATVSLASLLIIPALPAGAWIAERIGRPNITMIVSFIGIAVLVWTIPYAVHHATMFAVLGLAFGPAGGLIMALPARVLSAENRAIGMGVFYTVYYVGMGVLPAIAGYLRDQSGDPAAPFRFAALMILVAMLFLFAFLWVARRPDAAVLPAH